MIKIECGGGRRFLKNTPPAKYFTKLLLALVVATLAFASLALPAQAHSDAGVNYGPTTQDDDYSVDEDGVLEVAAPGVFANDVDPDGDTIEWYDLTPPSSSQGSLVLKDTPGGFTFTPAKDYHGTVELLYVARDSHGATSNLSSITITVNPVNDAPVANDDTAGASEDGSTIMDVLVNDTDADGPLGYVSSVRIVKEALNGLATANPSGHIAYTPEPNYNGTDSFTYEVCDNGDPALCDTAAVSLTVLPANDAPNANNDSYEAGENATLEVGAAGGVLANDTDPESDTLRAKPASGVSHGTLNLRADGSFAYTPNNTFEGTDTFTYEASDDNLDMDTATVTITVASDNKAPDVSLTSPGERTLVSGAINLTADASDAGRVSRVEFLVDNNKVGEDNDGAPYEAPWSSGMVSEGSHSISARAFDVAGNQATSAAGNIVVDNIDPETAITSGPLQNSFVRSTSAKFSFSSTEAQSTFECKLDTRPVEACASGKSYTGLAQGKHTLRVWAVGSAGRADDLDATPAVRTWTVDTAAPSGTVKINNGAASTRKLGVALNLAATDTAPTSGLSKMRLSHDGKLWTNWKTYAAKTPWSLEKGKAGTRGVFVQFMDGVGNPSEVVKDTIKYAP